jgi:hypothetical protein
MFLIALVLLSAAPSKPAPEAVAEIDSAWVKRNDPAVQSKLVELLDSAVSQHPDDFEIMWRAARLYNWLGGGAAKTDDKKRFGKRTWDYGEHAIRLNSKRVEGHYWAACGIGLYGQAVGVLAAMAQGIEGKFLKHLENTTRIDSGYEYGGAAMLKGRYHFELPWPKRDLDRSRDVLRDVITKYPQNLRAHYYLAETERALGNQTAFGERLASIEKGDDAYDPPEAARIKRWAKDLTKP